MLYIHVQIPVLHINYLHTQVCDTVCLQLCTLSMFKHTFKHIHDLNSVHVETTKMCEKHNTHSFKHQEH